MKQFLKQVITEEKQGLHIELIKGALWIASIIFSAAVRLRVLLYGAGILPGTKMPKPVISVGNITTGGTGKTPLVAYLARQLTARGKKPVILIRGYMQERGVDSDEATLLRQETNAPVLVGADRAAAAKKFLQDGSCDCFVMDDGFSHLRLKRDLDIVVIDTTEPWGKNYLLPRGFLREPLSHLKRAHVFVLTRSDQAKAQVVPLIQQLQAINPDALICSSAHRPVWLIDTRTLKAVALTAIKDQTVCALSALGSPAGFERTLRDLGAKVAKHFSFPDHYVYTDQDIRAVQQYCLGQNINILVTTEKDRVKMDTFFNIFTNTTQLLSLKIDLTITEGEDALLKRVVDLL